MTGIRTSRTTGKSTGGMRRALVAIVAMTTAVGSLPPLAPTVAEASPEDPLVVSMGDSYSAGEGNPPFYGSAQDLDEDWLAHRSTTAWPGKLRWNRGQDGEFLLRSRRMGEGGSGSWLFTAVSGATTESLLGGQVVKVRQLGIGRHEFSDQFVAPQVQRLDEVGRAADCVTLTLGGNDAGFANIVKSAVCNPRCLNPNGTKDLVDKAIHDFNNKHRRADGDKAMIPSIHDSLSTTYTEISLRAGNPHIMVAGYPLVFDWSGALPVTSGEAGIINDGTNRLNDYIEDLVEERQSDLDIEFVPMTQQFMLHGIGSDAPYINGILYLPERDDTEWLPWTLGSHYSAHPNEDGMQLYADIMQDALDAWQQRMRDAREQEAARQEAEASRATVDKLREFEERHDAILVAAQEDPRNGGNMAEMRSAAGDHYSNSDALATEIGEWLAGDMGVDRSEIQSLCDRREAEWQRACEEIDQRIGRGTLAPLYRISEHATCKDALVCDLIAIGYDKAGDGRPAVATFDEAIAAARAAYRDTYGRDPSLASKCYAQPSPRRYKVYAYDESNQTDHSLTAYPDGRVHDDEKDAWLVE